MLKELPRLDDVFHPKVDPHDHSPRPGSYRVGHRAVAATDIQHALSRRDALHEKVVVLHQPVLDVHATVILDCQTIDTLRENIVGPQQDPHGSSSDGFHRTRLSNTSR